MLLQVEADLQKINSAITIPHWNWTIDAVMPDPKQSPIWSPDFMGGNGVEADGVASGDGPSCLRWRQLAIPPQHDGPALRRRFATSVPTLPSADDLALAMNEVFYDTPAFNSGPFTLGFRNRLRSAVTVL